MEKITKEEAVALVAEKKAQIDELYDELAALAKEHGIYVYVEGAAGYGSGCSYDVDDDSWVSSSSTC